jgi:DNA polymerase III alpha subunit
MHPCGVLLSDASLLSRTPVMPTSGEGFPMAQFDKDDVEDLGLLKLDVLGVFAAYFVCRYKYLNRHSSEASNLLFYAFPRVS